MWTSRSLVVVGISGAMAVALGALGAHALKNQLETGLINLTELNAFDTASKYQLFHTLAMLLMVVLHTQMPSKHLRWSFRIFMLGIVFFSGSLYLISTRHLLGAEWLRFLGPVTPLGGLFFMAGWLMLVVSVFKNVKAKQSV